MKLTLREFNWRLVRQRRGRFPAASAFCRTRFAPLLRGLRARKCVYTGASPRCPGLGAREPHDRATWPLRNSGEFRFCAAADVQVTIGQATRSIPRSREPDACPRLAPSSNCGKGHRQRRADAAVRVSIASAERNAFLRCDDDVRRGGPACRSGDFR